MMGNKERFAMPISIRLGRLLVGLAMVALGAICLRYADFIMEWTPVPPQLPARAAVAYVHGSVLIVAGLGLFFERTVRLAALVLGSVWLLWTLVHVPRVIASWRTGLGGLVEAFALTSGLFLLAVVARPTVKRTEVLISRYCYAFCLPMLGVVHFLYPDAVANFIPKWIPAHLFWAYFTGVAFWAAGLAILSGVQARLGSRLLAIMLSSWVLILHIPRVVAAVGDRHEWDTLLLAVAQTGAAWIVTGSLERLQSLLDANRTGHTSGKAAHNRNGILARVSVALCGTLTGSHPTKAAIRRTALQVGDTFCGTSSPI
jgi:uncharacterized membrane protein